jgi:hypothetical protein
VATKDRRIADVTKKILGATESAKTRGEQAAEQLKEKLADGDWTSAGGRLGNYSTFVSILGMGDVLRGQKDGWARIEQYAYGQAFKCIANPFGLSSFKIAVPAAYLLVLDEQPLLTRYLALASKDEKRGFTNQTFAANFVAALAERASGDKKASKRPLGIYEAIFDSWNKPTDLAKAIHAACEHHLEGVGLKDNVGEFEHLELVPVEVAALRAVREKEGLELPEVDHPLLQTPLANIPRKPTYQPEKDVLLQKWLKAGPKEARALKR